MEQWQDDGKRTVPKRTQKMLNRKEKQKTLIEKEVKEAEDIDITRQTDEG